MNKLYKIFIFVILVFLIIGVVNAAASVDSYSNDTIKGIESHDIYDRATNDNLEDKIVKDDTKNIKKAQSSKNIYVNQETGDDINGLGTKDKPFESLNNAIYYAENNDNIILTSDLCLIKSWNDVPTDIYTNITISSSLKNKTTIYCGSMDEYKQGVSFGSFNDIFNITKGCNVKFYNLKFNRINARTVIDNHGLVTIDKCDFINCSDGFGDANSAIIVNYNKMNITNSNFKNNRGMGGCHGTIFNKGMLNISNSNFTNNSADNKGGSIFNEGSLQIKNSKFINNSIESYSDTKEGWSIYNNKTLSVTNTYFEGNYAINGSQIANYGNASINNCEFKNTRYSLTHLIYNNKQKTQSQMIISNSIFNNLTGVNIFNKAILNIDNCKIQNIRSGSAIIENHEMLDLTNNKILDRHDVSYIIDNKGKLTANNNLFKNTSDGFGVININGSDKSVISRNIFDSHEGLDSTIHIIKSKETIINYNTFINNKVELRPGGTIFSNCTGVDIAYNKFIKNSAPAGAGIYNGGNNVKIRYNNFTANKATTKCYSVNNKGKRLTITGNVNYYGTKYPSTIENTGNDVSISNNRFEDNIKTITTTTTVNPIKSTIGEKLILKALVKDNTGTRVDGGRVIFKLNGITLKDNGKFTGSTNPLKVYVSNGEAITTITTDLSMKNVKTFTASYIGTNIYNKSASNTAKAEIKLRTASITVTSNTKTIKQGQTLTLTAKIYDTTNGGRTTNLVKYADEFVYFKVNNITLKDSKGQMLKVKIVNGTATTKYTIPLGLSGITDGRSMNIKNHTILAGFYNKNYQENIRNTNTFQVERSNITITISNATVNKKTHKLSLTATIKDYLGNIVKGPNKCVIKINGVTLKNGTQPMYYYSTNGILSIKDINIPSYNKYNNIEIVTQDRLAYKSQRNTTTKINIIPKEELKVVIANKTYDLILNNNTAGSKFKKLLPQTYTMSELNGNEKYVYLNTSLTSNPVNVGKINAGDLMLYQNNCIVIFYKTFNTTYSYTPLGHVNNLGNLGSSDVIVKFVKS